MRTTQANNIVELRDVTRQYAGNSQIKAVAGISLKIDAGEFVAITGRSGSGKSTLLNLIGTLDRPTAGRVLIDGFDTSQLNDKELAGLRASRIGFVFQQFHLLEGTNAVDNVAAGLLYRGIGKKVRYEKSRELLDQVGLSHRFEHFPSQLSGGERQRVAIARALIGDPSIVLADEPTGNLDVQASEEVVELLHRLHSDDTTIAVITHDPTIAEQLPRQITVSDGQVASDTRQTFNHVLTGAS